MRSFRQITHKDRVKISRFKAAGLCDSAIARKMGFHRSTISREFKKNCDEEEIDYESYLEIKEMYPDEDLEPPAIARDRWTAEFASKSRGFRVWRANQIRRRKDKKMISWVVQKLKIGWTPEQIAGRSKIDGPEKIGHEFILFNQTDFAQSLH